MWSLWTPRCVCCKYCSTCCIRCIAGYASFYAYDSHTFSHAGVHVHARTLHTYPIVLSLSLSLVLAPLGTQDKVALLALTRPCQQCLSRESDSVCKDCCAVAETPLCEECWKDIHDSVVPVPHTRHYYAPGRGARLDRLKARLRRQ